jgi:hypothetical protein
MTRPSLRLALAALAALAIVAVAADGRAPRGDYPATPRAVVEAYLAADLGGAQTASETWPSFARYAVWPDAPGWDTFTIVAGYTVSAAGPARVKVVYHVLGVLEGEQARAERREQTVVYRLVRRRGAWKVAAPQLEPHVSPEVALGIVDGMAHSELFTADPEKIRSSRALVEAMVAAKPGA